MFEARLIGAGRFKRIVQALSELVADVNLDVNEDGISMQSMDSSHVALVVLTLEAAAFQFFQCTANVSLGINVPSLLKIMKCAGADDTLTLRADDRVDEVTIMFESPTRLSDFQLKLLDIDVEHVGIPPVEFAGSFEMVGGELRAIVRDLSTMGDTLTLRIAKEEVRLRVDGELGRGTIRCRPSTEVDEEGKNLVPEDQRIVIETDGAPIELQFALRYLAIFTKYDIADRVFVGIKRAVPMLMRYTMDDLGELAFWLAPKITDDDPM